MWNMPSNAGMPAIGLPFTVPDCQKPPRSVLLMTDDSIFIIAPPGSMAPSPEQVQLPSKNFRFDISAAGFGPAMAMGLSIFLSAWANVQGAPASIAATAKAAVIERALIGNLLFEGGVGCLVYERRLGAFE